MVDEDKAELPDVRVHGLVDGMINNVVSKFKKDPKVQKTAGLAVSMLRSAAVLADRLTEEDITAYLASQNKEAGSKFSDEEVKQAAQALTESPESLVELANEIESFMK